jgi:hypothetical protein
MWLSAGELAALPTSGPAWDEVVAAAYSFTRAMTNYTYQDSTEWHARWPRQSSPLAPATLTCAAGS